MNLPAYEERVQVVAVEIAERYYPAIAIAIAEAEGPRGDERVAGEVGRRKRPECGGGRGKEGEGCEEEEDGEASWRTEASTALARCDGASSGRAELTMRCSRCLPKTRTLHSAVLLAIKTLSTFVMTPHSEDLDP